MKVRHLETRTIIDPRGFNKLTSIIQRTVDLLLEIEQGSNELRLKYTRVLRAAVVDSLESYQVIRLLEELRTVRISNDSAKEVAKDLFAAAAPAGNTFLLERLIGKCIDVDAQSRYFGRALRGAAFGGHRDALLLLLDYGADPNAAVEMDFDPPLSDIHPRHSTPLQATALNGHEHIVRLLLKLNYHYSLITVLRDLNKEEQLFIRLVEFIYVSYDFY